MMRRLLFPVAMVCLIVGLPSGCEKKVIDSKKARVSGKVLLDGKPLKAGSITFDAQNGEPPSTLDILDGNYEGKAIIGKNKVMISAIEKISMKEKMKMDGP